MHEQTPLGEYEISTDPGRLDINVIHGYLTQSYWSMGISREVLERAIKNSMSIGIYRGPEQIGFARVITDKATFAYLADVFVLAHGVHSRAQGSTKP